MDSEYAGAWCGGRRGQNGPDHVLVDARDQNDDGDGDHDRAHDLDRGCKIRWFFIYVMIKISMYIFIGSDLVWDNVDTSLRDKCHSAKNSQFDKKTSLF